MRLWTRISLLAALNIGLLALALLIFVRVELSNEFESFLLGAAREKIQGITAQLTLDIQQADRSQWDAILQSYSEDYGVTFLLYGPNLTPLAGPKMELPPDVAARFRAGGGPRGRGGPPTPDGRGDGRGGGRRGPRSIQAPLLINSASDIPNWVATIFDLRTSPDAEPVPALLLLASKDLLMNSFFFDWRSWSLVLAAVLALSALCWLPFVRGLTHSIDQMTKATAEIAEGRFDVAVKVKRQDELGHLATSINRMASRLETFTRGQKRFLGDVAHELRSPLGRMQLAIGILERKAPEEAQQNVTDLREDIDLMAGLTDGLLQVARSGAKPEVLALQPVNVASIVQQAARREIPSNIAFESTVDESVNVKAHPEYLTAALSNLLRNAVRYAGESGPIKLAAQNERDTVVITVADSGPGVPEDALDKIFTPFYRLDDSRTSRTGGAGLGLAIVRTSIEACGGDVVARNRPEGGLEVEIKLPRA